MLCGYHRLNRASFLLLYLTVLIAITIEKCLIWTLYKILNAFYNVEIIFFQESSNSNYAKSLGNLNELMKQICAKDCTALELRTLLKVSMFEEILSEGYCFLYLTSLCPCTKI